MTGLRPSERDTAPTAILTAGEDTFLALASVVADEMCGRPPPTAFFHYKLFFALFALFAGNLSPSPQPLRLPV